MTSRNVPFSAVLFGSAAASLAGFIVCAQGTIAAWGVGGAILSICFLASSATLTWVLVNFRRYRSGQEVRHTYSQIWEFLCRETGKPKHAELSWTDKDQDKECEVRLFVVPHNVGRSVDLVMRRILSDGVMYFDVLSLELDRSRAVNTEYTIIVNSMEAQQRFDVRLNLLRTWPGGDDLLQRVFATYAMMRRRSDINEVAFNFLMLLHKAQPVLDARRT